jgi:hypothetical protein
MTEGSGPDGSHRIKQTEGWCSEEPLIHQQSDHCGHSVKGGGNLQITAKLKVWISFLFYSFY